MLQPTQNLILNCKSINKNLASTIEPIKPVSFRYISKRTGLLDCIKFMIHKLFTYCNVVLQTKVCGEVGNRWKTPITNLRVNWFLSLWLVITAFRRVQASPPCSGLGVRIQWFRIPLLYVK